MTRSIVSTPGSRGHGRTFRSSRSPTSGSVPSSCRPCKSTGDGPGQALLGVAGERLGRSPAAVRGRLRPAFRRVLPLLLASVRQQVDEGEAVAELLGATALRVVRPVHGVADAEEDVHLEPTARRGTHVGSEGAVRGGVPGHLVAHPRLVGERLVDRTLGDDDEAGVVVVEELEPGELARESGAARALPCLTGEPHVVVDDQLGLAFEHVHEPNRAVGAVERVLGQLHHREATAGRGDGVELTSRGLLPYAQLGQGRLPGLLVDDRRDGGRLVRRRWARSVLTSSAPRHGAGRSSLVDGDDGRLSNSSGDDLVSAACRAICN